MSPSSATPGGARRSCASTPSPSSPPAATGDRPSNAATEAADTPASRAPRRHALSSFGLQLSRLAECPFQKISFPRQRDDFHAQLLAQGFGNLASGPLGRGYDHVLDGLKRPLGDLVRMHVILLGELRERMPAMQLRQSHICLELRRMVPSRSSNRHLQRRRSALATDHFYHLSTCP
jgi:hypothetical protein